MTGKQVRAHPPGYRDPFEHGSRRTRHLA